MRSVRSMIRFSCLTLVVGSTAFLGCDREEAPVPTDPTTTPPQAQGPRSPEAQAQNAARAVTDQLQGQAQDAEQQAGGAPEATTANAQQLLDQAVKYINENKWDLAEQTLDQLDKIKASLPESMQQQVGNARQLLQTRKTAGNTGNVIDGIMGGDNK